MGDDRVRIEIDLNVRVRGNQTFAGYEDVDLATVTRARASRASGPVSAGDQVHVTSTPDEIIGDALAIGERVVAHEGESGLAGDAVVTGVDPARRLIYLAVDWHSMRDMVPSGSDSQDRPQDIGSNEDHGDKRGVQARGHDGPI